METVPHPFPASPEHDNSHTPRKDTSVSSQRRFPALLAGAGLSVSLFTGCGLPGRATTPEFSQSAPKPPSISQVISESSATHVPESFSILGMQRQFTKDAYKEYSTANPALPKEQQSLPVSEMSAPLLNITFDTHDKTMRFVDQTPQKLSASELKDLLIPVQKSADLLQHAFTNGTISRVVIRQAEPNTAFVNAYEAIIDEDYHDSPTPQKTLLIILNGKSGYVSSQELTDIVRHEALHTFFNNHTLDITSKQQPATEDLARYKDACSTLRQIATEEATRINYDLIGKMEAVKYSLHTKDQKILNIFDRVIGAISDGTFNTLQPKQESADTPFSAIIPECRAIGPYESAIRLVHKEGLKLPEFSDSTGGFIASVKADYQQILAEQSIYKIITESKYNYNAFDTDQLGHPQDNWSELVTSTLTVLLGYPEKFGLNVRSLSDDQKVLFKNLVHNAVMDMGSSISSEETTLRNRVANAHRTFNENAS